MRALRFAFIPAAISFAAFFMVLAPSDTAHEVSMRAGGSGYVFAPETLSVPAGALVRFSNDSGATHTASCDGCPWDSGDLQPGQFRDLRFDEAGDFSFFCRYHGLTLQMTGRLTVTA